MSDLMQLINNYYWQRDLTWPNTTETLLFAMTELGKACDLWVASGDQSWVRNNEKDPFSKEAFADELGDVLMMVMVAGYRAGVDPLESLKEKMERKLREHESSKSNS